MIMGIGKIFFIELLYAISVFSTEQLEQDPRKRVKVMYNTQMMSNGYINFRFGLSRGDEIIEFERFLAYTVVFIDKSLFIHHIHKHYENKSNPFAVTAPSKWGKSTLIALLKFFYMVELDKDCNPVDITTTNAYEFFNYGRVTYDSKIYSFDSPPLLSSIEYEELREKYLGKQPILVISFFLLFTMNGDVHNTLQGILLDTLHNLDYYKVIDHFCSTQKNIRGESKIAQATDFCDLYYSYFDKGRHNSTIISTIVSILYEYFDNRVILIIDEIEQYPKGVYETKGLSEKQRNEYLQFYIDILKPVTNGNPYILYTLLVGMFPFQFPGRSTIHPQFTRYFSKEIFPFFGLLDNLANELFTKAKLCPMRQKEMNDLYGHYGSPNYMDINVYNPYSVLMNLYEAYTNPWVYGTRQRKFIMSVIENDVYVRKDLLSLLQGECLEIDYREDKSYVPDISTFIMGDARARSKNERFYTDFKYHLWHVGYATIANTKKYYDDKEKVYSKLRIKKTNKHIKIPIPKTTFCLCIANNETRELVKNLLSGFQKLQTEAVTLFAGIINDHSETLSKFGKVFESLLNGMLRTDMHRSEMYHYHFIFHLIIEEFSRLHDYKFVDFDDNMKTNQMEHPYAVVHNNYDGVVIEMKFNIGNKKFKEYFDLQLCSYGIKFHQAYPLIKRLRLICLRVCKNKDRSLSVKIREHKPLASEEDFDNLKTLYDINKFTYASKPKRSSRNPDSTKICKSR